MGSESLRRIRNSGGDMITNAGKVERKNIWVGGAYVPGRIAESTVIHSRYNRSVVGGVRIKGS